MSSIGQDKLVRSITHTLLSAVTALKAYDSLIQLGEELSSHTDIVAVRNSTVDDIEHYLLILQSLFRDACFQHHLLDSRELLHLFNCTISRMNNVNSITLNVEPGSLRIFCLEPLFQAAWAIFFSHIRHCNPIDMSICAKLDQSGMTIIAVEYTYQQHELDIGIEHLFLSHIHWLHQGFGVWHRNTTARRIEGLLAVPAAD